MRIVINSVVIGDGKLFFLVNKKGTWILPGGKPNSGEQSDAAERELYHQGVYMKGDSPAGLLKMISRLLDFRVQ